MNNKYLHAVVAAGLLAGGSAGALAADAAPPADDGGWVFTAAPYLWASGIEGEGGLFGFPPQDIDVSFGDVISHLKFGFMGAAEARNGPITLSTDIVYARLGVDIDTPFGIAANNIDATVTSFMGTALAGYSVYYDESANFDIVAGARLWSADNKFGFKGGALGGTTASDGDTWVDPVIGTKFRADLGQGFYVAGWGLIGGFGVSSKFMWDVMGGVGYQMSDRMSMFAGYRAVDVDYRNDGFVFNVTQKGPIIGGTFRF